MQIYVSNNFHTKRQVTISPPSSPPTIFSQPIKSIPPFNSPQIRQPRSCQTDNTSFLVLILICQFRFLHAKRGYKHTHTHVQSAADCKFQRNVFDRYRFEASDKRLVRQHNYAYGSRDHGDMSKPVADEGNNHVKTRHFAPQPLLALRFDEK